MAGAEEVVRVLPDEPAIAKTFDYLVPDSFGDQVRVGDRVRIALAGRRVGGWIVEVGVDPPAGVALRPLAKWSGRGPGPDLIELARWAAWRWAGRPASLLRTASPERNVAGLPAPAPAGVRGSSTAPRTAVDDTVARLAADGLGAGRAVLRLPPAVDPAGVALAAVGRGHALVLCPDRARRSRHGPHPPGPGVRVAAHPRDWAQGAAGATVVGTRAAAWAPVGDLAAVVVVDEHDDAHQQEQAPTWHARDVALERARRAGRALRADLAVPVARGAGRGAPARPPTGAGTGRMADRRRGRPAPRGPSHAACCRRRSSGCCAATAGCCAC